MGTCNIREEYCDHLLSLRFHLDQGNTLQSSIPSSHYLRFNVTVNNNWKDGSLVLWKMNNQETMKKPCSREYSQTFLPATRVSAIWRGNTSYRTASSRRDFFTWLENKESQNHFPIDSVPAHICHGMQHSTVISCTLSVSTVTVGS